MDECSDDVGGIDDEAEESAQTRPEPKTQKGHKLLKIAIFLLLYFLLVHGLNLLLNSLGKLTLPWLLIICIMAMPIAALLYQWIVDPGYFRRSESVWPPPTPKLTEEEDQKAE